MALSYFLCCRNVPVSAPHPAFEDEGLFCSVKFAVSINQRAPGEGALSNGVQRC